MLLRLASILLLTAAVVPASPVDRSINEIDHGSRGQYKNLREKVSALSTNGQPLSTRNEENVSPQSTTDTAIGESIGSTAAQNIGTTAPSKSGPFFWFLTPLAQKVQFSPQSFLQDRLVHLREALNNLGVNAHQNVTSKQLGNGAGLLHLVGLNDSGFYTNRLEPAGFLGGNGWLANKGGILGGPGAIISTGSLLTDYPTPYRK